MPRTVREITTDADWDEAVPVIRQLWSHRDAAFVRSWRAEDDYRLFGLYECETDNGAPNSDESLVAVAGVSVQRVLHHERHCWIHDIVVDEPRRGEGVGEELLDWVDAWAAERDCEHVSLACWAENEQGRGFYESQGLEVWGHVMERDLE